MTNGSLSADKRSGKDKIERAAITLFSQRGIHGVSTKEIAKLAGLSEGSIYRHFKSKDELAKTLMHSIHTTLTQIMRTAEGQATLEQKVSFIVTQYCEIADADWDLFRYHILHLYHFPNLSETEGDNPQTAASDLLHSAMMRGEIPASDASILASMALGVVLQIAQSKVLGFYNAPLSPLIPQFTQTIMTVIRQRLV